jgi:hypothetical protein
MIAIVDYGAEPGSGGRPCPGGGDVVITDDRRMVERGRPVVPETAACRRDGDLSARLVEAIRAHVEAGRTRIAGTSLHRERGVRHARV